MDTGKRIICKTLIFFRFSPYNVSVLCKGGTSLIEISMKDNYDAKTLYDHLCYYQNQGPFKLHLSNQKVFISFTNYQKKSSISLTFMPGFIDFILNEKEDAWLSEMIENTFYYSEPEEQEHIHEIARSIIDGEQPSIPLRPEVDQSVTRSELIEQAFIDFLSEDMDFSFESFIKFRLKDYFKRLLSFVEVAIDEYKLEQDYQEFVDVLRRYINQQSHHLSTIHILHDKKFMFFDKDLIKYSQKEIKKWIEPFILKSVNADLDLIVLAPLVSTNPYEIIIYTDEMDNGMIITIQNIFQERVKVKGKKDFLYKKATIKK